MNLFTIVSLVLLGLCALTLIVLAYLMIRNNLVFEFNIKVNNEVYSYLIKQKGIDDFNLYHEVLPASYERMLYHIKPFKSFLNKELYNKIKENKWDSKI